MYKRQVHGLDRCKVLAKHGIEAAAALGNVAADAADEADVGVRIHKDLDIHLIAQGVVLKDQDTLDQNDLARLDRNGFVRAGIGRIVVDLSLIHILMMVAVGFVDGVMAPITP